MFLSVLRKLFIKSMIRSAMDAFLIPFINLLRRAYMLPVVISSYFLLSIFGTEIGFSFFPFVLSILTTMPSDQAASSVAGSSKDSSQSPQDYVEILGGNGPKVAAYIRISKKGQSEFSLDAQCDEINKMKEEYKPSKIYWFFDQRSSKSDKDFDKLKITEILRLREKKEISELWTFSVSRVGRTCRKLLYFFLEFCDDDEAVIRTPEGSYRMKDLQDFIDEAKGAEKENQNRVRAVMAGKSRSFKQRRWNKRAAPFGYSKDVWLQKIPDYAPLIKEVHRLYHVKRCFASVSHEIGTFHGLLPKPLTPAQIRRILSDPVYIGKPQHLGVVVVDPDLAFIDEETSRKSLDILSRIRETRKPKRMGPIEKLAVSKPITFLQVLEIFELHHKGCGGIVWKNGTTRDEGPEQQLFRCKKCPTWWRLPPIKDQDKHQSNSMGALNFDNPSRPTKNNNTEKSRRSSADSTQLRPKLQQNSSPASARTTGIDLLGNPVNDCPAWKRKRSRKRSLEQSKLHTDKGKTLDDSFPKNE